MEPDLDIELPLGVQPIEYVAQTPSPASRGTGSCSSPTATWNATPCTSTSKRYSLGPSTATRDRSSKNSLENVLAVTGGKLQDDATAVCIDWYGAANDRDATGGASQARTTRF